MGEDGGAEEEHVLGAAGVSRVPAGRAGFGALFGGRGWSLALVPGPAAPGCPAWRKKEVSRTRVFP